MTFCRQADEKWRLCLLTEHCGAPYKYTIMAAQELEQGICQKFGWSTRYFKADGYWAVEVSLGIDCKKTFISEDSSSDSIKGRKQGKKAAALVALESLKEDVRLENDKPLVRGLGEAVRNLFDGVRIVESCDATWQEFWSNPPDAVGIDTEGNSLIPPVLIQIANDDTVILEMPSAGSGLSCNLQRLLDDDSIIKVLCDSPSQKDKVSLGIQSLGETPRRDIVNLEEVASSHMGNTSVPRGLSNLLCLTIPELGVRIAKESASERLNNVRTFTAVEQGFRPRLFGFQDLTPKERRYAAVDAWCTLLIWRRISAIDTK